MANTGFRPFLVADRPASLRILRGANPHRFPNGFGIMTHANITSNVEDFIREFPASGGFYSVNGDFESHDDERKYVNPDGSLTGLGEKIRQNTTIISDSGAFLKEGSQFDSYEDLFNRYEDMEVDYGIILDVLNDPEGTIDQAHQAISTYEAGEYSFNLIGVAQGTNIREYLECYREIRDMGYDHIAVGGLLEKHGNRSGAFAHIDDEEFLETVLGTIRNQYPSDWLFALGCHHPNRHGLFEDLDLFGADYKGWIYKYNKHFADTKKARNWRFQNVRSFVKHNTIRGTANHPDNLLLLPCSNSKRSDDGRIRALDRYCGQYYQVLKKWQHEVDNPDQRLDVLILSARYGLLDPDHLIEDYDEVLSEPLSGRSREEFENDLYMYLKHRSYDQALLVGGKPYRETFENCFRTLQSLGVTEAELEISNGRLGEQLSDLKSWLHNLELVEANTGVQQKLDDLDISTVLGR